MGRARGDLDLFWGDFNAFGTRAAFDLCSYVIGIETWAVDPITGVDARALAIGGLR